MRQEDKSVIFKDIEMGPTVFERESFVPVCISLTFVCTSKGSEILYRGGAKTKTRCISEPFEVQTKVREVRTGTDDSLSNASLNLSATVTRDKHQSQF